MYITPPRDNFSRRGKRETARRIPKLDPIIIFNVLSLSREREREKKVRKINIGRAERTRDKKRKWTRGGQARVNFMSNINGRNALREKERDREIKKDS